jgi:hypothetical protein
MYPYSLQQLISLNFPFQTSLREINPVVVKAGKKPEGSAAKTKAANASLSVGEEVPQNSLVTLSSGIRKRDATFARLSLSRLQLGISSPRVYSFSIFHK